MLAQAGRRRAGSVCGIVLDVQRNPVPTVISAKAFSREIGNPDDATTPPVYRHTPANKMCVRGGLGVWIRPRYCAWWLLRRATLHLKRCVSDALDCMGAAGGEEVGGHDCGGSGPGGTRPHRALGVPLVTGLLGSHGEGIGHLNDLLELVSKLVSWAVALGLFVLRLWGGTRRKRSQGRADDESSLGRSRSHSRRWKRTNRRNRRARSISGVGDVVSGNKTVTDQSRHAGRDPIEHQTNIFQQAATATAPTLNALHSLPPPPADFTGREAELAEL
jgi:hypothetical protein